MIILNRKKHKHKRQIVESGGDISKCEGKERASHWVALQTQGKHPTTVHYKTPRKRERLSVMESEATMRQWCALEEGEGGGGRGEEEENEKTLSIHVNGHTHHHAWLCLMMESCRQLLMLLGVLNTIFRSGCLFWVGFGRMTSDGKIIQAPIIVYKRILWREFMREYNMYWTHIAT